MKQLICLVLIFSWEILEVWIQVECDKSCVALCKSRPFCLTLCIFNHVILLCGWRMSFLLPANVNILLHPEYPLFLWLLHTWTHFCLFWLIQKCIIIERQNGDTDLDSSTRFQCGCSVITHQVTEDLSYPILDFLDFFISMTLATSLHDHRFGIFVRFYLTMRHSKFPNNPTRYVNIKTFELSSAL